MAYLTYLDIFKSYDYSTRALEGADLIFALGLWAFEHWYQTHDCVRQPLLDHTLHPLSTFDV